MGFFDDLPEPELEPPRGPHRPWQIPEAELPCMVPIETLHLARTDQVAVAVTGISAYSAGYEIILTSRLRPEPAGGGTAGEKPWDRSASRLSLRFGLQLADGTKVIGGYGGGRPGDAEPTGPILRGFLFGGSRLSHFTRWWAWPLPPAGPLDFVCEWPLVGIAESRYSIDARLIRDAAGRSVQLWPEPG
jgi:hypothetical protein